MMSPMEEFITKKRRITWIGVGVAAILLVAIMGVSSALSQPYRDIDTAIARRDEYITALETYQRKLENAQSQLAEISGALEDAQSELEQRKNELDMTQGEEQETDG